MSLAQGPPPGERQPPRDRQFGDQDGPPQNGGPTGSTMRGGLQLGPPGRWWDDEGFARGFGLRVDQQRRMDAIFEANRDLLISSYQHLKQEERALQAATRGMRLEESKIFEQIDRVAQARAALEKANAHMLLNIRMEMTPEQVARLDERRPR